MTEEGTQLLREVRRKLDRETPSGRSRFKGRVEWYDGEICIAIATPEEIDATEGLGYSSADFVTHVCPHDDPEVTEEQGGYFMQRRGTCCPNARFGCDFIAATHEQRTRQQAARDRAREYAEGYARSYPDASPGTLRALEKAHFNWLLDQQGEQPVRNGRSLYRATVELVVLAGSGDEARDAVSGLLSEQGLECGRLVDWRYAREADAQELGPVEVKGMLR